jgi:hypothetical protein
VGTQVATGGEGEAGEVGEGLEVVGVEPGVFQRVAGVGQVLPGVAQGPAQALELEGAQALGGPGLYGFEGVFAGGEVGEQGRGSPRKGVLF